MSCSMVWMLPGMSLEGERAARSVAASLLAALMDAEPAGERVGHAAGVTHASQALVDAGLGYRAGLGARLSVDAARIYESRSA